MADETASIVVTGAAGFIGSHLCRLLLNRGDRVLAVDNFSTGYDANLEDLGENQNFSIVQADVSRDLPIDAPVKAVVHLACAASPPAFMRMPIETLRVGSAGTLNALELAHKNHARFLLSSSSEVYGDPLEHPQKETYYGNVDPIGPRSMYDESKRFSEAATAAYRRSCGTNTAIVRPFNVYGPGMSPDDGRVIPSFCAAALRGVPLQLHGDGSQTRSLCYIDDFLLGLMAVLDSNEPGPFNIGSEEEITMRQLADVVIQSADGGTVDFVPGRYQDVAVRRPDISRMRDRFKWSPSVSLSEGVRRTVEWMRPRLQRPPVVTKSCALKLASGSGS
jgi:dTDP-glucose 4,6-dehydratase